MPPKSSTETAASNDSIPLSELEQIGAKLPIMSPVLAAEVFIGLGVKKTDITRYIAQLEHEERELSLVCPAGELETRAIRLEQIRLIRNVLSRILNFTDTNGADSQTPSISAKDDDETIEFPESTPAPDFTEEPGLQPVVIEITPRKRVQYDYVETGWKEAPKDKHFPFN